MPQNNHCHGDIGLVPSQVPVPETADNADLHVLQKSDVTLNRHEVVCDTDKISRFTLDGKEYVRCPSVFVIRHVGGDCEHGVQEVEPGTYEVRHELELDPLKNELRRVLD